MSKVLGIWMLCALLTSPAQADELDPLIGTWVSPDGLVKQSGSREPLTEGAWIRTEETD